MDELQRLVLEHVKEEECVDLIKKLVPAGQPEAENPADPDLAPGREEKAALVVAEELRGISTLTSVLSSGGTYTVGVPQTQGAIWLASFIDLLVAVE